MEWEVKTWLWLYFSTAVWTAYLFLLELLHFILYFVYMKLETNVLKKWFNVHGFVHHSTNHIEITNKMQPCHRIYYPSVLLIAHRVPSDTPLIIRSSKTVIAASGCAYICGCRLLQRPATTDVRTTRGRNYSFWAPDDERCVARNTMSS